MISVVLPCLNEVRHGYLPHIVENLLAQEGEKELIAVVSPSHDGTLEVLTQFPAIRVIPTVASNRAERLNLGIQASTGAVVLLHHPATLLPPTEALQLIEQTLQTPTVMWGGFRHQFDWDHWLLRFTSWYSNQVRPRWSQILYLDHCIFARRSLLTAIGGIPNMDIFEDTVLSQRLSQQGGAPCLLPATITTSARRFRSRGVYHQALLNQALKAMYHLQIDPRWMNRLYEQKTQINVNYAADAGSETSLPPAAMLDPQEQQR